MKHLFLLRKWVHKAQLKISMKFIANSKVNWKNSMSYKADEGNTALHLVLALTSKV